MSETIEVKFDKTQLPKWAQDNPSVLRLCEQELGYRLDVIRAGKSRKMKTELIRQAENIFNK